MSLLDRFKKLSKRLTYISRARFAIAPPIGREIINLRELLELYKQEPMVQRALDKRAKDLFEAGFEIETRPKPAKEEILKFIHDVDLIEKLTLVSRDAMVFGNGFAELQFDEKNPKPEHEPQGALVDILPVNPLQMVIVQECNPENDNYGEIVGYLSMPPIPNIDPIDFYLPYLVVPAEAVKYYIASGRLIHPKRIIHLKFNSLSDSPVGMSLLEPVYHILKSKIQADKVLGLLVRRYAKPIIDITVKNATPEQIKRAGQIAQSLNQDIDKVGHIAHDEFWELDLKGASGRVLDLAPILDYFMKMLAVSFGIPKTLLIGAEQGTISGSDLNLIAYFQSLETDQNTVLTPILKRIINTYYEGTHGTKLKELNISWNRLYSDEIATVKAQFMGVQNMLLAYEKGLLPKSELRKKLCELFELEFKEDEEEYQVK